jgi:O-antigen/teichoic acid export membrane protein
MNYIKKIAGHTAIYGLSSVVPRLLNYLLFPLHTRVFLQEDYGIVTELYAYLAVLIVLLTYGMETGFFRFSNDESKPNESYSTAFIALLFSSTLFIALTSLFSKNIVSLIGYDSNPEYIVILGLIIGLDAFSTIPYAKLRMMNKPFTFAIIKVFGVGVNVLFNIFFLVICPQYPIFETIGLYNPSYGITYIFISNLIGTLLTTIVIFFIPGLLPTTFSFSRLRILLIYSFPLLISGIGGSSNEFFDRIFLKYLTSPDDNPLYQLGIYGANVKLAVLMTLFIQMYRYAVEPFIFSNIKDKDTPEKYANLTKFYLVFALLIFLVVGLFTDIFQILSGKNFREGVDVVPILLMSNLFFGLYFNFSVWFKIINKTWFGIIYTSAGSIITIVLYVLLIPKFGYYGAAFAKLFCYIIISVLCYYGGKKQYPIPYNISRFVTYILFSVSIFFIGYFIKIDHLLISYVFRLVLILAFVFLVLYKEKLSISNILNLKRNEN